MAADQNAGPLGGRLTLRHASKRSLGTWGPNDWDVIDAHRRDIGRIFKPQGVLRTANNS